MRQLWRVAPNGSRSERAFPLRLAPGVSGTAGQLKARCENASPAVDGSNPFRRKSARKVVGLWVGAAAFALATTARADTTADYVNSAHQLEKSGNLRGASIQLRNAAQAAPGNAAIRLELAKAYLKLHNPNAAEAELFAAHLRGAKDDATAPLTAEAMLDMGELGDLLKNVPAGNRTPKSESTVRSYRGMAELGLGEYTQAAGMFADAERLDPKSTLPLIGEARLFAQQHRLDEALKKADQATRLDPKDPDGFDAKGMILEMQNQPGAAMREFTSALAADPGNLRAMLDRANLETSNGNIDGAERDLGAIGKIAPGSVMAVYLQAMIDAERGKYREADTLLDKIRDVMSSFPPAYLVAAEVKFKLNQPGLAESFLRKLIAQTGPQPKAYQLLGAIALKRGQIEEGIADLEKAAQLAPNDVNILAALGQAYVSHGDLEKAKSVFALAAAKAPGNAPLATERALTNFAAGDRQESVVALSELFRGGKGSLVAGPPLVIEALQLGQLDVAEAAVRELLQHDPANPTYQELLAAVRIGQHDYAGAEIQLRGLLAKQPNLASARRDLAQVYLATNRTADAKKLYQDRLNANPKDSDSLEALADIALQSHDQSTAMKLLAQAQNVTPTDPRPSLRMLGVLKAQKKWADALGRARALVAKFKNDPSVADALAQLCFEAGNHPAAVAAYKSATARFSNSAPLFAHYAAVLAADKQYAAAAPLALRAARLDPRSPGLKRAYVTLAYLGKGPDAALAASQTVTDDKTGEAAVVMTADVLAANNNRAGAMALLEKRKAQRPSTAIVVRLAGLYQADSQPGQAVAMLESWAAAHSADVEARFALAQAESATGKLDQALAQYEWLATQRPDNPVILNNLAWLYSWNHDPRARETAERAMKLAPASGSVADTLGWILAEQGDETAAAKYLAQASASQPTDGSIQYHYAVVLSKTGKADQARGVLQKLLKLELQPQTKSQAQLLLVKLGGARGN